MKLISIPQADDNYLSSPIEENKGHLHFHDGREGLQNCVCSLATGLIYFI